MNKEIPLEERILLADAYRRKVKIFENKYRKQIHGLLQEEYSRIAEILKRSGIDEARKETKTHIFDAKLTSLLIHLYKEVGIYFANSTYRDIKKKLNQKSGSFGLNPQWLHDIVRAFQSHVFNTAVLRINETTRDKILQVLREGEEQGLSIDEMARELVDEEISIDRARVIARTETAKAANIGRIAAVDSIPFQMEKNWITANDERVRPAHAAVDGVIVDEDENFIVGGEEMSGAGDPNASPENIVNCRCNTAFIPKRDQAGRLIPKT